MSGRVAVRMRLAVLIVLLTASRALGAEPKTLFDYADGAWAIGTIELSSPLKFRDGKLLAFPGVITDLVYADEGKPRNLMLIHEVSASETEPLFKAKDVFFAPIRLLPQYSYWRDNLPNTRQHEILGGPRNVFRGDEIPIVKKVLSDFAEGLGTRTPAALSRRLAVAIEALSSPLEVVRKDAVRYLGASSFLARAFPEESRSRYVAFLTSDAPEEARVALIQAAGRWKVMLLADDLEPLVERDDALSAPALAALVELGRPRTTETLQRLVGAKTQTVREQAYQELGARAGEEPEALAAAAKVLESPEHSAVRAAAARGLGRSQAAVAVSPLAKALVRGDEASRAAADALAAIGDAAAVEALRKAVVEGPEQATIGAVFALTRLPECADCVSFLLEQHEKHPGKEVRKLIGIALELDAKHEH